MVGDGAEASASPGWMTVPLILAGGTAKASSFCATCGEAAFCGVADGAAFFAGGAGTEALGAAAGVGLGEGFSNTSNGETKSKGDLLGLAMEGGGPKFDSGISVGLGDVVPETCGGGLGSTPRPFAGTGEGALD